MISFQRPLAVAACVLIAWHAGPPDAQAKLVQVDSMEWMVAEADLVILGTIVGVVETTDTAGNFYRRCQVRVNDRLKGNCPDEIEFIATNPWPADGLAKRQQSGGEVLLLLKRGQPPKGRAGPPADYRLVGFRVEFSAVPLDGQGGVLTMDSKKLTDPAEILQAVKEAIRLGDPVQDEAVQPDEPVIDMPEAADAAPEPAREHIIDTPWDSDALKEFYSGSSVWLRVPVNDQLQERARRWVRSDDVELRLEGAKALVHFQSEENEALLRKALNDNSYVTITRAENGVDRRFTWYAVRQAAHAALSKWEVDLTGEPPFEVPLPAEDD